MTEDGEIDAGRDAPFASPSVERSGDRGRGRGRRCGVFGKWTIREPASRNQLDGCEGDCRRGGQYQKPPDRAVETPLTAGAASAMRARIGVALPTGFAWMVSGGRVLVMRARRRLRPRRFAVTIVTRVRPGVERIERPQKEQHQTEADSVTHPARHDLGRIPPPPIRAQGAPGYSISGPYDEKSERDRRGTRSRARDSPDGTRADTRASDVGPYETPHASASDGGADSSDEWARRDSNARPLAPEASALSS